MTMIQVPTERPVMVLVVPTVTPFFFHLKGIIRRKDHAKKNDDIQISCSVGQVKGGSSG